MRMKNDGRGFQREVETVIAAYERKGILTASKVDPPCRIIGGGRARRVIFLPNPHLDFDGAWTERGGRKLVFEAKTTEDPRLEIGSGGLRESQLAAMQRWSDANAVVFVLWQVRVRPFDPPVRLITLNQIRSVLRTGQRSIQMNQTEALEPSGGFVLFDFAAKLRALFP